MRLNKKTSTWGYAPDRSPTGVAKATLVFTEGNLDSKGRAIWFASDGASCHVPSLWDNPADATRAARRKWRCN
jgi:hypothetical protein